MRSARDATTTPEQEALQAALATEHACVFVLGALGAQTSATAAPALYADVLASYRRHQQRRDELTVLLQASGAEPVAAEPGYDLPAELGSPVAVRRRARALEQAAAAAYAYLVANSAGTTRRWAADALVDAAVRQVDFGGHPSDLPGLG